MKVFITRRLPLDILAQLDQAKISYTVWDKDVLPSKLEFVDHCKDVDGVFNVGAFPLGKEVLTQVKHLKVISLMSVGYDHVDISMARALGIKVGHTPDVSSNATADVAFLLLLATSRKAFYYHRRMLSGQWGMFQPMEGLGVELRGKTLGIFGMGKIGFEMARRCKALYEMEVVYHNRSRNAKAEEELDAKYVSWDQFLANSDVISVHSALTEQTRNVFEASSFKKMKSSAIFINTARGGLVNEKDLIEALDRKIIWGAGLDVFETEPTSLENRLLTMENVTTLPHIGSSTQETRGAMAKLAMENLIAGLQGKMMPAQVI